jgi:hypothetical protein
LEGSKFQAGLGLRDPNSTEKAELGGMCLSSQLGQKAEIEGLWFVLARAKSKTLFPK